ncbi:MAG: tRNA (N(6)-L-threonylcarbamoyladenosine(37)-C(2))-methylthiotransferase MtaB [Oscillospiraceae bacterium]|jgi:threonylcarbamoyladenosine tRNA methylthiotransferase MtaB|nr:tRNA (N(6)-L-threonylcarbamoyladenosine(37)-C(2))-methylthiotransferase MtaB [Oscillospiraceae bacterium]
MRFCVETLGCKVNQFESQAVEAVLTARGHTVCAPGDGCDVCIVNTCSVTAESGRKSRQAVRRLRRLEKDALVAVCGCYAQLSPDAAAALGADIVMGSGDRIKLADTIERVCAAGRARRDAPERIVDVCGAPGARGFERLPAGSAGGRTRALLKIQDGCDNFCAYCVIPLARGRSRSLPADEVGVQAGRLADAGYCEIVITGIELSSYGADGGGYVLADALRAAAAAAPGIRLRLGSLWPGTVTRDFARALSEIRELCPHFHLSLQSGCDGTLRRMGRRYTTGSVADAIDVLRGEFPGCGITADLIAGFPGETDGEFDATLDFIERCAFSRMHIFPFSARPGTAAAAMPEQQEKKVKRARAAAARALAGEMSREFARRNVGAVADVLFETQSGGVSAGYAGNYLKVFARGAGLRNLTRRVVITRAVGEDAFGVVEEVERYRDGR